eukprot:CAMPEP_0185030702 /NCGR_PEP_ID=MMETSP1103-20130426/17711_1 /TAXON_ID=36769 /ORGANISM="Paraphysomonas bandaiensis, Strain Caron Lab Isolate" /LENGTH=1021 /DNA_ID=CAMNT_0027565921 /DNA_START=233 /DNA_END=3298 /DNA_ORIENTATION=+
MYEVVGVDDAEDRKKLYFLIQRLQSILKKGPGKDGDESDAVDSSSNHPQPHQSDGSVETARKVDVSPVRRRTSDEQASPASTRAGNEVPADGESSSEENDLRVLRRQHRSPGQSPGNKHAGQSRNDPRRDPVGSVNRIRAPSPIDTPADSSITTENGIASALKEKPRSSIRLSSGGKHGGLPRSLPSHPVREATRGESSIPLSPKSTSAPSTSVLLSTTGTPRRNTPPSNQEPKPISTQLSGSPIVHRAGRGSLRDSVSPPPSPPPAPPPSVDDISYRQYTNSNYSKPAVSRGSYSQQENFDLYNRQQPVDDMAIRVVVRKRPVSRSETGKGDRDVLEIRPGGHVLVHEPKTKVDLTKVVETQEFFFDDAFFERDTNELIYARAIRPLVDTAFEGGKASCFAYGQTGSGKTFTMMGSNPSDPAQARKNAGLYVLAARDIFELLQRRGSNRADEMKVMVSCFEIYGGKLFDLLNERGTVRCLEDSKQQVQLPGLTEHQVKSVDDLLAMMGTAHEQRSTGSTGANLESSRSHQVLQLSLQVTASSAKTRRKMTKKVGQLSFIDLAGSERGADTRHNSKQTRMEGAEINTSLLALKEVIRSLEKKQGHTPFRGSKLTQVLKDSFVGDNTKTCMVACVSPNMANCEHTLNTLRYADRVKEHQTQATRGKDTDLSQRPMTAGHVTVPPTMEASTRPSTAMPSGQDASRPVSLRADRGGMSGGPIHSYQVTASSRSASMGVPSKKREVVSRGRPPPPPDAYEEDVPLHSARVSTSSSDRVPLYEGRPPPPPAAPLPSEVSTTPDLTELRFYRGGNNSGANKSAISNASNSATTEGSSRVLSSAVVSTQSQSAEVSTNHSQKRPVNNDIDVSDYFNSSENSLQPPPPPDSESDADVQLGAGEMSDDETGEDWCDEDEENRDSDEGLVKDVEDTDEPVIFDYENKSLGGTVLLQRTVDLVSAHKLAIAEMVEVMKEEMELVQDMEQTELRDSHQYVSQLEMILAAKKESVDALRKELKDFQTFRFESKA